jgi:hypothetical protein
MPQQTVSLSTKTMTASHITNSSLFITLWARFWWALWHQDTKSTTAEAQRYNSCENSMHCAYIIFDESLRKLEAIGAVARSL